MSSTPVIHWRRSVGRVEARSPEEQTAFALFERLAEPPPLSAAAWARIRAGVEAKRRGPERVPWTSRFVARLALAGLIAVGVQVAFALGWRGIHELGRYLSAQREGSGVPQTPAVLGGAMPSDPSLGQLPPAPGPSRPPSMTVPSAEAASAATVVTRAAYRRAASKPSEGQRLFEESGLMASALRNLQAHRPAEALQDLSRYHARFSHGMMAGEAALTEVRAYLDLGLDTKALARLEDLARTDFEGIPRPDEARLLRAELLARTRDCPRAIQDFDKLLVGHLEPALDGRALYGRAACRAALGDSTGSRADLSTYLARFPDGPFAGAARAGVDRATR